MNVLITGGAGFIGSHIAELLLQEHYRLIIVDNFSTGQKKFVPHGAIVYEVDLESPKLEEVFKKERPHIVFHLAAQVDVNRSIDQPISDATTNILGTINLLNCCQKYQIKKIIYSSSSAVYGEPVDSSIAESAPIAPSSFYGISKYVPELYLKTYFDLYGLEYAILRYANVYGPRQSASGEGGVVSIFCHKLLNGDTPSIYGDGEQTRDFVFVKDVAKANVLAIQNGTNETFNISCNESVSINQLYRMLAELTKSKHRPNYQADRKGDIRHSRLNNQKAQEKLYWSPTFNIMMGLTETVAYYQNDCWAKSKVSEP